MDLQKKRASADASGIALPGNHDRMPCLRRGGFKEAAPNGQKDLYISHPIKTNPQMDAIEVSRGVLSGVTRFKVQPAALISLDTLIPNPDMD